MTFRRLHRLTRRNVVRSGGYCVVPAPAFAERMYSDCPWPSIAMRMPTPAAESAERKVVGPCMLKVIMLSAKACNRKRWNAF